MQQLIDNIVSEFKSRFNNDPTLVKSPGRVNLIGEHTDYNDGFVLSAAIDKKIILALAPNGTDYGRFYALDMEESFETDITSEPQKNSIQWTNYILGVIDQLKREDYNVKGFDCVFGADIPIGSGLSSSAVVEGGIILGLSQLFNLRLSKLDMALLGQKVENEFVGIRCGIMDQFVNIHGEEGSALKLDCRNLEYELYSCFFAESSLEYHFMKMVEKIRKQLNFALIYFIQVLYSISVPLVYVQFLQCCTTSSGEVKLLKQTA